MEIEKTSAISVAISKTVRAFESAVSAVVELFTTYAGRSEMVVSYSGTAKLRDVSIAADGIVTTEISKTSEVCDYEE